MHENHDARETFFLLETIGKLLVRNLSFELEGRREERKEGRKEGTGKLRRSLSLCRENLFS